MLRPLLGICLLAVLSGCAGKNSDFDLFNLSALPYAPAKQATVLYNLSHVYVQTT